MTAHGGDGAEVAEDRVQVVEYAAARGVEKVIRIDQAAGQKRGRADASYGNAIIEFEKSLLFPQR